MTALSDLSWPEAQRRGAAGAILAVPVGSTEQHGPHLPLSTDTDIAVALATRLAAGRRSAGRDDVVVAPAVGYGSSGEHAGFAGTISIGQQATELVLLELGRSAAGTFAHLVFVSAHGGNAEPAARAVTRLGAESRDVLLWTPGAARRRPFFPPVRFGADPDAHAGRTETSIQLALAAGRVRTDRAEPGNPAPLTDLMPLLRSGGVRAVSPNGILGDPSGSTAAEGAALLDALTADLLTEVATWRGDNQP